MIKIKRLDHISLNVPDPEALSDFYVERWGLQLFDRDEGGTIYLRTSEAGHHALSLHPAAERRLGHIGFEVAERDDLDRAVEEAIANGVAVEHEPGVGTEPGHRANACLRDPDGNLVELVWAPETVTDAYDAHVAKPRKVGHVVLNTPDPTEMETFYRRLGYRVSDRTIRGMSFMRSATGDHHSLALVKTGGKAGVQHIAYDVVSLDNVMTALGSFRQDGFQCVWGPGRHGPGNNIFTYYRDPAGHVIEYYAEMEQVVDSEEADVDERFWGAEHKGDRWGIAGVPPIELRDEPVGAHS